MLHCSRKRATQSRGSRHVVAERDLRRTRDWTQGIERARLGLPPGQAGTAGRGGGVDDGVKEPLRLLRVEHVHDVVVHPAAGLELSSAFMLGRGMTARQSRDSFESSYSQINQLQLPDRYCVVTPPAVMHCVRGSSIVADMEQARHRLLNQASQEGAFPQGQHRFNDII